jgi:hypothetical protein
MTPFTSSRSVFSLTVITFAVAACSSSTTGTGASSGTSGTSGSSGTTATPVSAADCASRCEAKLTTCGADGATAKNGCSAQVCNASPSADQLTCLEGKTCDQISGSTGFASLCPAATTTTPPPVTGGAMCGTATCATGEYCSLSYDSSTMAFVTSGCKKVPATCASKGASELCTCMKDNSGCSTSGLVSTKCSQTDGALTFGCQ